MNEEKDKKPCACRKDKESARDENDRAVCMCGPDCTCGCREGKPCTCGSCCGEE